MIASQVSFLQYIGCVLLKRQWEWEDDQIYLTKADSDTENVEADEGPSVIVR